MFNQSWRQLNEYDKILLFIVVPAILVLFVVILDLVLGRRVSRENGRAIFRPSLAIQVCYGFGFALLSGACLMTGENLLARIGAMMSAFEILRQFPSAIQMDSEGIRWRRVGLFPTRLAWGDVRELLVSSAGLNAEIRVIGGSGQSLSIFKTVFNSSDEMARSIEGRLAGLPGVKRGRPRATSLDRVHWLIGLGGLLLLAMRWPS